MKNRNKQLINGVLHIDCLDCGPQPLENFYQYHDRDSVMKRCRDCYKKYLAERRIKQLGHARVYTPRIPNAIKYQEIGSDLYNNSFHAFVFPD